MNFTYCWHRPGRLTRSGVRLCRHCGVGIEDCPCVIWRQAGSKDCEACEGSGWVGIVRSKAASVAQALGA